MGVTTHFFAFDPEACAEDPTVDGLLKRGAVDRELTVSDDASGWLKEIESQFNHNKRWYANLDGDSAWSVARRYVKAEEREPIDRWLAHLFWDDDDACPRGQTTRPVADGEVVYDAAYLDHILALECSLLPVEAAMELAFPGGRDSEELLPQHDSWWYCYDGLCQLVWDWQNTLLRARRAGPTWSLLRWVWI